MLTVVSGLGTVVFHHGVVLTVVEVDRWVVVLLVDVLNKPFP